MFRVALKALTETVHVHIDRLTFDLLARPYLGKDLRPVDDAIGRSYKEAQELKLPAPERYGATVERDFTRIKIQAQTALLIYRVWSSTLQHTCEAG